MTLRVGDTVQVRTPSEILATLDERGRLEELPFMPQMIAHCGQRFRVSRRAHKLCDTVNGTGARRLTGAVFLGEVQCDGQAFGGCEMECSIVWKEAWLQRVDECAEPGVVDPSNPAPQRGRDELTRLAIRGTRRADAQHDPGSPTYACQATQIPFATTRLSMWDPRQYVDDLTSGNARLSQIVSVLAFFVYDTIATSGLGVGAFMRWAYERVQALRGGAPYPARPGKLPRKSPTPTIDLGIRAGDLVQVKTQAEILETVTEDLVNRGMMFHPEMVSSCAGTFSVAKRVSRLMNEKTGKVVELKNPCLVLDGVPCRGHYSKPLLCPRGMSPYWREIWVERIEAGRCAHPSSPNAPAV